MATIAGHRGRDMRCGFPLYRTVVVAFRAAARSDTVVSKERRLPVRGSVAAVTVHRRGQVVCWFERGHDAPAGRVALETLCRRAFKYPLQVTPFAFDLGMATSQRKSRHAVVNLDVGPDATLGFRLVWRCQSHEERAHQRSGHEVPPHPVIRIRLRIHHILGHVPLQPR